MALPQCVPEQEMTLIEYIRENNLEQAVELLNEGVGPDVRDAEGATALMIASKNGYIEVARSLLAYSPNVDAEMGDNGLTALKEAVQSDNLAMVNLLLEAGADVNVDDANGETVIFCAIDRNHYDIIQSIIETGTCQLDICNSMTQTAMHFAVWKDKVDCVRTMLEAGANPEQATVDNYMPLMCARSPEVVDLLVSAGADPNSIDENGESCLYWAIRQKQTAVADSLIRAGADVNQEAADGTSPVYIAVSCNYTELAKLLLAQHKSLTCTYERDNTSATLLDIAIKKHLEELSNLLFDLGCPVLRKYSLDQQWPRGVEMVIRKLNKPRKLQAACGIVLRQHYKGQLQNYLGRYEAVAKSIAEDILLTRQFLS